MGQKPRADFLCSVPPGCPCGYYADPNNECTCTIPQVQRYRSKISGPLMDRIDIHIEVPAVKYRDLANRESGESSREIKKRIDDARRMEASRRRLPGKVTSFDIVPPPPDSPVTTSHQFRAPGALCRPAQSI